MSHILVSYFIFSITKEKNFDRDLLPTLFRELPRYGFDHVDATVERSNDSLVVNHACNEFD